MTKRTTASEAKTRLLALLDEVQAGQDIEITKHGRVVARLVPARGPHALEGTLAGAARSNAADDELFTTGVRWDVSA